VEIKTVLKASVAAGALLALAAPMDAVAGGKVSAGNSKVDVTLAGRVHRSIHYIDDGKHDQIFQGSGISSNSEIWLTAEGKLTESVSMGAYMRWDIPKNDSSHSFGSTTGAAASTDLDATGTLAKYEYIYFKSASMGTLSMGAIEPAADGTIDTHNGAFAGDAQAYLSATDITLNTGAFSGTEATSIIGKVDPALDTNRIRYDSPSFSGFSVGGDLEQGGGGSVALKYSGTIAGLAVGVAAGYEADGGGTSIKGGSVKLKHSTGIHASVNYGKQNVENSTADPEYWRVVAGYDAKMNSLGNTNISLYWEKTEDKTTKGNKGEAMGIGIGQKLDAVGGNIQLDYMTFDFSDAASTQYQDIDVVLLETSFNF
jgi:hypothetical protein